MVRGLIGQYLFRLCVVGALAASLMRAAADDDRPPCIRARAGEFWPSAANTDKALALKLSRCGELEVCSRKNNWRFQWEPVTVSIQQLQAKRNHEPPPHPKACLNNAPNDAAGN